MAEALRYRVTLDIEFDGAGWEVEFGAIPDWTESDSMADTIATMVRSLGGEHLSVIAASAVRSTP